ncbi:MAG TPA: ABC transporter substrate-binding protein [Chloroflexota bacterium]|nr:ABC transporter substrate-binding protein [Chloroflexota bacterium]
MALRVTLACGATDRTMPLINGDVRPAGIDLTFLRMYPEEVFWRMTRHAEFDAAEMSLSSYLLRRSRNDDALLAIPVFTSRMFRHSCVWVRRDAGINEAPDLRGKRLGVPEYQVTAAVWIRGFLSDDYGVRPTDVHWYSGGMYQPGRVEKLPIDIPGLDLNTIRPDQTLSQMLEDGEIDGIIGPRPPSNFPGPKTQRLFPDFRHVEADYFKRTGVFPIMHTVVVRRELLEREPWVARNLYDAFTEAKARVMAQLTEPVALAATLPWQLAEVEETRALMGDDYWPYGVNANRATIDTLIRYSCEQGLAQRAVPIDDLFAPSTLDDYRI